MYNTAADYGRMTALVRAEFISLELRNFFDWQFAAVAIYILFNVVYGVIKIIHAVE